MKIPCFFLLVASFLFCSSCQVSTIQPLGYSQSYAPSHIQVTDLQSTAPMLSCKLRVSAIDYNGDVLKYEFDWENNGKHIDHTPEWSMPGFPVEVIHQYPKPGKYKIRIIAVNYVGAKSNSIFHEVTIP